MTILTRDLAFAVALASSLMAGSCGAGETDRGSHGPGTFAYPVIQPGWASPAPSAGGSTPTEAAKSSSSSEVASGILDPNVDGPYTVSEFDASTTNPSDGHVIPIHCAHPVGGPTPGPYPVIVIAHGFQLSVTQYEGYLKRLASFGYIALTADYPTKLWSVNNVDNAHDLLAALDWVSSSGRLLGNADASKAGMTGHSLGGKLALLAATYDSRVKASINLDPVDGGTGCTPAACPDASRLMPSLHIPTAFLGETTDASGGFFGRSCAPAADNFATFYAGTNSPSIEVTVRGANHMSFLDDAATCGLVCSVCNPPNLANAQVNSLAKAFVVAFYERYLRGNAGYDAYLTGAEARSRYVATKQATIASR